MSRNTLYIIVCMLFVACSTTKNIPEDDQLFVGLKKIQYINDDSNGSDNYADHELAMKEEVEAALAIAPNGALFGSSYYRTPFAPSLWIWNAFSGKDSGFARWMTSSFGKPPVLMTTVNPDLRSSVAQSILQKQGLSVVFVIVANIRDVPIVPQLDAHDAVTSSRIWHRVGNHPGGETFHLKAQRFQ